MTFEEAQEAVCANLARAPSGSHWSHLKSGGTYAVLSHVMIEATREPAVVYRKPDAPLSEKWCRPASEFFDGRFAPAESPAPSSRA